MTQDEIIEMARQSGIIAVHTEGDGNWHQQFVALKAFAKLVTEKEREACAKLCDDRVIAYQYATDVWAQEHINEARHLAKVIRARGNT